MKRLAAFARWPEPGRVKTRLSPALPVALACELHRAMLADTLRLVLEAGAETRAWFWADAPHDRSSFSLPALVEARDQRGADLGARLSVAFEQLLAERDDRAVILGTDCPGLAQREIGAAFDALEHHDAVLGPTHDGGYYLIGLRRLAPQLFRAIEWSSARVLAQTLERAEETGLNVTLLDALEDLDAPADLVRLIARGVSAREAIPLTTARALRELGLLPPEPGAKQGKQRR